MTVSREKEQLDVDRKFVALIVFAISCILLLIVIINLSANTTSGIRAYIMAEGNWTKAQKESVIHLMHYIFTEDEEHYEEFKGVLNINLRDKEGRIELSKEDYSYESAYENLLAGQNHPEDAKLMIQLLRRFGEMTYVKNAINAWELGDAKIQDLLDFAEQVHAEIAQGKVSEEQKNQWLQHLNKLNFELTVLEVHFSEAMGNMARLTNNALWWSTLTFGFIMLTIGIWLIIRYSNSTKAWLQVLKNSEEKFKHVLANSRDVLYKMDLNTKKYVYVSPALKDMLGYEAEMFKEGGIEFIQNRMHPEDKERLEEVIKKYSSKYSDGFLPVVEFRMKDAQDNWVWVSNVRSLVRDEEGNPTAIIGIVRDISTKKEQAEKIEKSLHEKEVLLQEIHHRVKNNLAIISSLLELQKEGMSEEVINMLSSSQSRIKSIAKVHEKLYESTTLSDIPLDTYITELAEEIENAYQSGKKEITLEIDVDPIKVNINEAIPIGLVLNEVINNAFKHGFKDLKKGTLRIRLKPYENEELMLAIENNGHKMKKDFEPDSSESLGMTLIKVLAQRISGRLEIEQDEWVRFKIFFQLEGH
jgi:PAS domain S-box-containing protein